MKAEKNISAQSEELTQLRTKRDALHSRIWQLALGILAIFGVPAATALALGKYLESVHDTRLYLFLLLGLAFIVSWAIVIAAVVKIDKASRKVEKRIKELEEIEAKDKN